MVGRKGHIDYSGKTEDSRVSRFFELYKLGKTDKEIETETGSTHMMIYNWRKRFGLRKNQRIQPATIKNVSKNDLNYIAGFLDGEGCVSIRKLNMKRKCGSERFIFAPIIEMSNTNLEVLEFIRERLGLTVNVNIHESGCRGNRKMSYKFAIKGWRNCLHTAKMLIPYSIVKQKQLYILIKFCEGRTEKLFMNTPYEEKDYEYYNTIFKLNSHGKSDDVPQIDMEGRFLTERNVGTIGNPKIGNSKIEIMSEENAQYLAGFFDAEGNITLGKTSGRLHLYIAFVSTNKAIIDFIKNTIGINNKISIIDHKKLSEKIAYRITITSFENCHSFGIKIFPFLIVKRERMQTVIDYIEMRISKGKSPYGEEENIFYERMKLLNHRGL
jgi:hypothetical protein